VEWGSDPGDQSVRRPIQDAAGGIVVLARLLGRIDRHPDRVAQRIPGGEHRLRGQPADRGTPQEHQHQVLWEISRIHPFAVCPVQGPHAISNSFGIWVQRSEKRGGDHVHQGNDISAPSGTPIVAPFDGIAVASPNKIGGLAVKVFGDFGYVYNAHLSAYGHLGSVHKGDVVGYVGSTGNAGGPHDHFEWHPGNGAAVDPYGFLMQVC